MMPLRQAKIENFTERMIKLEMRRWRLAYD